MVRIFFIAVWICVNSVNMCDTTVCESVWNVWNSVNMCEIAVNMCGTLWLWQLPLQSWAISRMKALLATKPSMCALPRSDLPSALRKVTTILTFTVLIFLQYLIWCYWSIHITSLCSLALPCEDCVCMSFKSLFIYSLPLVLPSLIPRFSPVYFTAEFPIVQTLPIVLWYSSSVLWISFTWIQRFIQI